MHHVALGCKNSVCPYLKILASCFAINQLVCWTKRVPSGKVLLMARAESASIPGWSKAFDRRFIKIKEQIKSPISSFLLGLILTITSTLLTLNLNILFTLTVWKTSVSVCCSTLCSYLERRRPQSKVQTSTVSSWMGVVTSMEYLYKENMLKSIISQLHWLYGWHRKSKEAMSYLSCFSWIYDESSSWQCWFSCMQEVLPWLLFQWLCGWSCCYRLSTQCAH